MSGNCLTKITIPCCSPLLSMHKQISNSRNAAQVIDEIRSQWKFVFLSLTSTANGITFLLLMTCVTAEGEMKRNNRHDVFY